MSETLKELRSLSDEELVVRHDELARQTQVGVQHYLSELARRDQDRQTKAILRYTIWIAIMTIIMTIATLLNVFVFLYSK